MCVVVVDTWWGWLEGKAKKHRAHDRASAEFKSVRHYESEYISDLPVADVIS